MPSTAIIITTFNDARFLADALASALNQTRPASEIIVVDDGSDDHPDRIVAKFEGVRLIRQTNQGLSAARNTGLAATRANYVSFLDADDMLLPHALELGLAAHEVSDDLAFVYGGHRRVDASGQPIGADQFTPLGRDPFGDLLLGNAVGMHATAMFDRPQLAAIGGYDSRLRRCEDYDVFLRLARQGRVRSYPEVVALYRMHGSNMSRDRKRMARTSVSIASAQAAQDPTYREMALRGRRIWQEYYAGEALRDAREALLTMQVASATAAVGDALQISARTTAEQMARHAVRRIRSTLPTGTRKAARALFGRVPVGWWNFGSFGRTQPASHDFGWDRGTPIDRYYIEAFLSRNRGDIRGRVLEVGDDAYSRRFGGTGITRQDILHVHAGNERASIVGDLSNEGVLPDDSFDCIVLTQTLHLVYDMRRAIANLHRALRPGGVLLVTSPGISQLDRGEWGSGWYWSMTPAAASRLFGEVFDQEAISVEQFGNVYAAVGFLTGLALTEVKTQKLDVVDEAYPVIVAVRATK